MADAIRLKTPLSDEDVDRLQIGDRVLISGVIYTGRDVLSMNVHFRSNDAYKAAFMNMYAFTELQAMVAAEIGVAPGEYMHIADSFHIYGSYFDEFAGFLQTVGARPVDQRVYTTEFARDFFVDGCDVLLAEEDMPEAKKQIVRRRREELLAK